MNINLTIFKTVFFLGIIKKISSRRGYSVIVSKFGGSITASAAGVNKAIEIIKSNP